MTTFSAHMPDFPENPGDGFQIQQMLPDGGYVMWTYSQQFNQWTYEKFTKQWDGYLYGDQVLIGGKDVARTSGSQTLNEALSDLDARITALEPLVQRVTALEGAVVSLQVQVNESP